MEGYLHPLYAESFSEIGEPLYLPKSHGWLIKRKIPGTLYFDAMGPYPLFFCLDWNLLIEDIFDIKEELVCISFVIDPLQNFPFKKFEQYFDVFYDYKDHFFLDTGLSLKNVISSSRRQAARRALKNLEVDLKISPHIDLDEWVYLYSNLVRHHNIRGIRDFSRHSFKKEISIPNTHYFRIMHGGEIVGGNIFYIQQDVAYSHLSAYTKEGYDFHAGYAVKWSAIKALSRKVRWIELGGGAKTPDGKLDGLGQFKKGWSSGSGKSYFCGKILNQKIYDDIAYRKKIQNDDWFPVYRSSDF